MNRLPILPLLFLLGAPFRLLLACSCEPVPTFVEDIRKETLVFQVEVLQHQPLPVEAMRRFLAGRMNPGGQNEPPAPLHPYNYTSYTLLLVVDAIMGKAASDTIVFFNGSGAECLASMESSPVGSKFILKLKEPEKEVLGKDLKEYLVETGLSGAALQQWNIYAADDCHQWRLWLDGAMVSGNITRNEREALVKELNSVGESPPEKRADLLGKIRNATLEKLPYQDFVDVVRGISSGQDTMAKPKTQRKSKN